jgi:hypothetical protein
MRRYTIVESGMFRNQTASLLLKDIGSGSVTVKVVTDTKNGNLIVKVKDKLAFARQKSAEACYNSLVRALGNLSGSRLQNERTRGLADLAFTHIKSVKEGSFKGLSPLPRPLSRSYSEKEVSVKDLSPLPRSYSAPARRPLQRRPAVQRQPRQPEQQTSQNDKVKSVAATAVHSNSGSAPLASQPASTETTTKRVIVNDKKPALVRPDSVLGPIPRRARHPGPSER